MPFPISESAAQHRQGGDYAKLGLVTLPSRWNATISCCLYLAARELHSFQLFNFSTFRFWHAIHQHSLIPLTSKHLSPLNIAYPTHRSLYSQVKFYDAAPTSLSLKCRLAEKRSLTGLGILRQPHESLQTRPCGLGLIKGSSIATVIATVENAVVGEDPPTMGNRSSTFRQRILYILPIGLPQ